MLYNYNLFLENTSSHADYLKWKRKNVTLRGMKELGKENGVAARFGDGLYQAYLSNMRFAKTYGDVYFVVNGRGKKPKVVQSPNYAEIFIQNVINAYNKEHNIERYSDFYKHTDVKTEVLKLGYDSLEISGVEMVNYAPDMDKIKFFKTESELQQYYYNVIQNNIKK